MMAAETNFQRVAAWHEKFDAVKGDVVSLLERRASFLSEECREALEAMMLLRDAPENVEHKRAVAKELADVLCVTYGALYQLGIDGDKAFEEVWRSNMSKTPNHGGKAIKGADYVPAKMERVTG